MGSHRLLAHLVSPRPWAILHTDPAWSLISRIASGELTVEIDDEAFAARHLAASFRERLGAVRAGNVEIIPVHNAISQRYTWLTWALDGTALEWLRAAIAEAVADPEVGAIVLDVDSPGGSVDGMTEFAADLRAMRDQGGKPIVAVANPLMASGALYVSAGASEIVLTPSGMAGSVGVVMIHQDISRALDAQGVKVTVIRSGEFKAEANPFEPLPEEALARLQVESDHYETLFYADLAKGRGLAVAAVRSNFGQGRVLLPAEAIAAGMVDRVDTLENTVRRLARTQAPSRQGGRGARASLDDGSIAAVATPDVATADPPIDPPAADAAPTPVPQRQPDPAWVRANAAAFDRAARGAPRWHD